ncbi:MAG TPA: ATP synthase F1 subunit epsilon [Myxococcales bacterium]|nr:ATP synthase F1 subunit epsilon [Myxococcales bacterium]
MQVQIVTPLGEKFSGTASSVKAVTVAGEVGVLPGHRDMLTALGTGSCVVSSTEGDEPQLLLLDEGYLQVSESGDKIIIVTELAEFPNEIDRDGATAELNQGLKALDASKEAVGSESWKILRHNVALAQARLDIAG